MARIDAATTNVARISSVVPNSSEIIDGLKQLQTEVLNAVGIKDQGYLLPRVYTGVYLIEI